MANEVTIDQAKEIALQASALFEKLALLPPGSVLPDDISSRPVGLRDTGKFNLAIAAMNRADITAVRRDLVSAISAEKWVDGFMFAMQIIMMAAAA